MPVSPPSPDLNVRPNEVLFFLCRPERRFASQLRFRGVIWQSLSRVSFQVLSAKPLQEIGTAPSNSLHSTKGIYLTARHNGVDRLSLKIATLTPFDRGYWSAAGSCRVMQGCISPQHWIFTSAPLFSSSLTIFSCHPNAAQRNAVSFSALLWILTSTPFPSRIRANASFCGPNKCREEYLMHTSVPSFVEHNPLFIEQSESVKPRV